jgi:hypothetical protein
MRYNNKLQYTAYLRSHESSADACRRMCGSNIRALVQSFTRCPRDTQSVKARCIAGVAAAAPPPSLACHEKADTVGLSPPDHLYAHTPVAFDTRCTRTPTKSAPGKQSRDRRVRSELGQHFLDGTVLAGLGVCGEQHSVAEA